MNTPSGESVHMCSAASVMSDSLPPHGLQPTGLLCPQDSPGKNTRVGCDFLLQVMVKEYTNGPAVPLLGIYPEKTIDQKDTCTSLFIAALFTTAWT